MNTVARLGWRHIVAAVLLVGHALGARAQPDPNNVAPGMAPAPAPLPLVEPDELLRRVGGPTLITVHLKDAKPQDVIGELARQSGLPLAGTNTRAQAAQVADAVTTTLEADGEPFWRVMQRLLAKDFTLYNWNGIALAFQPGGRDPQMQGPALERGPLLIVANSININRTASRVLDAAAKTSNYEAMSLRLNIYVDPHLRAVGSSVQITPTEVRDENGASFLADNDRGRNYPGSGSRWMVSRMVPLLFRADAGKKLNFRGMLRMIAITKSTPLTVPDIMNAKEITRQSGDVRFTVVSTKLNHDGGEVRYTVSGVDRGQQAISFEDFCDEVQLVDAQGRVFQRVESNSQWSEGRTVQRVVYKARAEQGPPAMLKTALPEEMVRVEVPLEFNDLPMP